MILLRTWGASGLGVNRINIEDVIFKIKATLTFWFWLRNILLSVCAGIV